MERLRGERTVFYSEADFQHALAWNIHEAHPEAKIRLEIALLEGGSKRLDLFVAIEAGRFGIELKYPRSGFAADIDGEPTSYVRGSADAADDTRYAIAEDLRRVERLVEEGTCDEGCVVALTNTAGMWNEAPVRARPALDSAFRIHEGSVLSGRLSWGPHGRRKPPVELAGSYLCRWQPFSELADTSRGVFNYLVLASSTPLS